MADYLTDEEQMEQVKGFVKQYGPSIVLGIVLALGGSYGWRTWQTKQLRQLQTASSAYEQMLGSFAADDNKSARAQAQFIVENYRRTPYATLAAFRAARDEVENKEYKLADEQLQWIIDHSKRKVFTDIATLRRAQVLLAEKKYNDAIESATQVSEAGYRSAQQIIVAHAYIGLKQKEKAKAAYADALAHLPERAMIKPMIGLQLDDLS